jgi:hypothetical protein
MRITSANQAIDVLGGTYKVARLFDLDPRVVSNWRSRGLPPDTYAVLAPALLNSGYTFSPLLFGQKLQAIQPLPPPRKPRPKAYTLTPRERIIQP